MIFHAVPDTAYVNHFFPAWIYNMIQIYSGEKAGLRLRRSLGRWETSCIEARFAHFQELFERFTCSKSNWGHTHANLQSWTNVLEHLRFWGIFQFTQVQPLPSPHKQCWTRVSRFFSEFQLCIGWGEEELQENFECTRMHYFKRESRSDRKIWVLQYCPKDFCPGLWIFL